MKPIPYVQRVRREDGRVDLYFRRRGVRRLLRNEDGTDALRAEVEALVAELDRVSTAQAPRPGTVRAALDAYAKSGEFRGLAVSTRREYERLMTELKADAGDVLLAEVTPAWVRDMRDAWAERGYKAANDRRTVLSNALAPCIVDGDVDGDPFARVPRLQRPHDAAEAHPTWEDNEIEAAIELAIARKAPGLARAIALGRWGGFRRQSICNLPLSARVKVPGEDGEFERRILWLTEKKKVLCDRREDARLTALLARTPNRNLRIAYNTRGEPWKERQLNQAIERLCVRLAEAGKARAGLTPHGLRHARGVELALAGASDAELMAQLDHATDRAAKIYRRQAQRRQLADAGQDRIDNVIRLRERRADAKAGENGR